mgnify:CR=1 FL=1
MASIYRFIFISYRRNINNIKKKEIKPHRKVDVIFDRSFTNLPAGEHGGFFLNEYMKSSLVFEGRLDWLHILPILEISTVENII